MSKLIDLVMNKKLGDRIEFSPGKLCRKKKMDLSLVTEHNIH